MKLLKKQTIKKIIPLLLSSFVLLLQFQNCAKKEFSFKDEKVTEMMSFFEYRYTKVTPIYFEIQILPGTTDENFIRYDILGFASTSDGTVANIDYEIEVFGIDNQSLCALKTGVLSSGETMFSEFCVINKNLSIGYAIMKVRKQLEGEWNVYTKIYNK